MAKKLKVKQPGGSRPQSGARSGTPSSGSKYGTQRGRRGNVGPPRASEMRSKLAAAYRRSGAKNMAEFAAMAKKAKGGAMYDLYTWYKRNPLSAGSRGTHKRDAKSFKGWSTWSLAQKNKVKK